MEEAHKQMAGPRQMKQGKACMNEGAIVPTWSILTSVLLEMKTFDLIYLAWRRLGAAVSQLLYITN